MRAQILDTEPSSLRRAGAHLAQGGLVGIPTETVYGLAASAFDVDAVLQVFACKERPAFDPLIVHVGEAMAKLEALDAAGVVATAALTPAAAATAGKLMSRFWPGPLTLVLPQGARIPDVVTSGLGHVGVRCPSHPVTQELIRAAGTPLAAPSANKFGRISPTTAQHVAEELGADIAFIVDAGPTPAGLESTVVSVADDGGLFLLRPGALPVEDLERCLGRPLVMPDAAEARKSPGHTASHYAPRKALLRMPAPWGAWDEAACAALRRVLPAGATVGVLTMEDATTRPPAALWPWPVAVVETLSPAGDDREAARRLFAALRTLDAAPAPWLLCEPCPRADGLWRAVQDRLRRASVAWDDPSLTPSPKGPTP